MVSFIRMITGQNHHLDVLKIERFRHPFFCVNGDDRELEPALTEFILRVDSLKELEVINPIAKFPMPVFRHLGNGLKALNFHGLIHEHPRSGCRDQGFSEVFHLGSQDLDDIAHFCPNISSLAIDMVAYHDLVFHFAYDQIESLLTSISHSHLTFSLLWLVSPT